MTLFGLRARGALRSLAARPVALAVAAVFFAAIAWGTFLLVRAGVAWLYDYPLIATIAPAVTQRSLEGLFLVLMAATLFSVLIASIGTLYGGEDLELLLAHPVAEARIFTMKTLELFVNAAGMPLIFTLPVLAGIGAALDAPPLYYLVSTAAAAALYALPVTFGALLALVLVRLSPAGRVREVATALSVAAAAAAVVGLRALRPERLLDIAPDDPEAFEGFLATFARLELGWLPPAWATNASWSALHGALHPALAALLVAGLAGLALTGALAHLAFARGWVRSLDAAPLPRARPRRPVPAWERTVAGRFGVTGAVLAKDLRMFARDVQQWSQLLVLVALAGVYFLSLAAIPVPTQQFRDAIGTLNIAFVAILLAGVGLRVAYPLVSIEAGAWWLVRTQPIRMRQVVVAKFLLALPIHLALALGIAVATSRWLDLSPVLATAVPVAAAAAALATTGLAVGMGAAHARFAFTNPNEIAASPGAIAYLALALGYAVLSTLLLARPAWIALQRQGSTGYWSSFEGLLVLALLAGLTALTTVLPLWFGVRRLQREA